MVMAVGDDQRAIEARPLLALDLHAPAAVDGTLGAGDPGVQLDLVEDVEIHGVGAQISKRLAMRRIGRIFVGKRIVLEAGIFARGDEIGGVVDDAGPGRLVPQPADIALALETVERNAALGEGLGRGEPRRPSADDADFIGVALHIHAAVASLLPANP